MDELQRKSPQRYEGCKPRKVRFKLASSYSGRVLKHVYEDGQELDSPEEKYPHSFIHTKMHPGHLEMEQLCGFQDAQDPQGLYPPTGVIAQRINVYRGGGGYRAPVHSDATEADPNSSVLDFGKIIIYTSNLRIIRAPQRKAEPVRALAPPGGLEEHSPRSREKGGRRRLIAVCAQEEKLNPEPHVQDGPSCQQCGGSGCAPCSLCHGSKLSMLANRFNESISVLRCQACYPDGLEKCQACTPNK
ncbi:glutaredoxin domain-containing cysteine-rich protein 2 [Osmerus mordax]|uniref:glutaredoxin domain-containing cysteine-rich protein 2 n=1 Tax=Osmerus mordax TaxID=8014 RepID=UPI00350F0ED7